MKKYSFGKIYLLMIGFLLMIGLLVACGNETSTSDESNSSNEATDDSTSEETNDSGSESEAEEQVTLRFSHTGTDEHQLSIGSFAFRDIVEEKSDGNIKIDIYNDGQLGSEQDNIEGVQLGTIDMTMVEASSVAGSVIPEYSAFAVPYLFRDREHVYGVFDGEIGQEMLDLSEEKINAKAIGWIETGFRVLTNSKKPIEKASDMDGLKFRVLASPIWEEFMRRFGAIATPLDFNELYSALEQGVVDGQENPFNSIVSMKFYEVQPHLAVTHHAYTLNPVFVNMDVWGSLSEQQQTWMKEAIQEAYVQQREELEKMDEDQIKYLEEQGVKITYPDLEEFRDKIGGIEEVIVEVAPESEEYIKRIKEFGK